MARTFLRRPSLAFPGGNPRFDPGHPASQGNWFSFVAGTNGACVLVNGPGLNPKPTTAGSPKTAMDGKIGAIFKTTGASDNAQFSGTSTAAWSVATMAAIYRVDANNGSAQTQIISSDDSGTSNQGLGLDGFNDTSSTPSVRNNGVNTFGPTITFGIPYFIAISILGNNTAHWVVRNLSTGQIYSGTFSIANGSTIGGQGSITIGNRSSGSRQLDGGVACCMRSAVYLSVSQLLQWAQDPWAFWYPATPINLQEPALGGFISNVLALFARSIGVLRGSGSLIGSTSLAASTISATMGKAGLVALTSVAAKSIGASMGRSAVAARVTAVAKSIGTIVGRASAGFAAPLSGRTVNTSRGAASLSARAPLSAQSIAATVGKASPVGTLKLAARSIAAAFGRLTPPGAHGVVTAAARSIAAAFGRAALSTASILQARGQSAARSSAAVTAMTKMSAQSEAVATSKSSIKAAAQSSATSLSAAFGRGALVARTTFSAAGFAASTARASAVARAKLVANSIGAASSKLSLPGLAIRLAASSVAASIGSAAASASTTLSAASIAVATGWASFVERVPAIAVLGRFFRGRGPGATMVGRGPGATMVGRGEGPKGRGRG